VSPELRELIDAERAKLVRHVELHAGFIGAFRDREPNLFECEATAAALHAFYNGVEFILRAIAQEHDGEFSKSGSWHTELLDRMTLRAAGRPAVLSSDTRERLNGYLGFRHRFRNLYPADLNWALMKPLALGLPDMLARFETDLARLQNHLR
jgi:hypothetical protein